MPQLDTSTFFSQLFWLVVSFMILYAAMLKLALPAIREVLQARQDRIANDIEKAEQARREAEAAKANYTLALEKARHTAVTLISETADKLKKETLAAYAELDATIEHQQAEAEKSIKKTQDQALKTVEPLATEFATTILQKLLHSPYPAEKISVAVHECNHALKH